jgi:hypothetical protein
MPQEPTISLRLPEGKTIDVYLVRLADGRIVSRTREELEESPPGVGAQVLGAAQPGSKP